MSFEEVFTKEFNQLVQAKVDKALEKSLGELITAKVADAFNVAQHDAVGDQVVSFLENCDLTDHVCMSDIVSDELTNLDLNDYVDVTDQVEDAVNDAVGDLDLSSQVEDCLSSYDLSDHLDLDGAITDALAYRDKAEGDSVTRAELKTLLMGLLEKI